MDQPSLQPIQTQSAQESYPSPPLPEYVSASDYHEGLKQIRAHLGRDCGFGITISRTKTYTPLKTGEKRVTRVALQCAKAKEYQSKGIGHKVYASRMTNCPWRAKMTPHPGGGWKVIPVVNDHNHPLTDPLNDRGLPPRARTTPAKGARTAVADSATPPTAGPYTVQSNFLPTMSTLSAWPTATPSGVKRTIMPMHQRVLLASRMPLPMNEAMLVVYNDKFNEMLGGQADLKMVLQDTFPFAHQAGVFFSKNDSVFVSSNLCDIPTSRDKVVVISKLTRSTYGDWSRQQLPQELKMASGGVYYNDGILDGILFCSQGDLEHSSGLSQLETEYPFRVRTLLDNYHGRRFNSLKEVAIHSDGSIWFTDPVYGYDQGSRPPPELPNQVYRFDPNTGDVRVMADGFGRPSGICFSPMEKVCYISDTDFIHGNGNIDFTRASTIYAYDIEERSQSKFLTKKRVFAMADIGVPDGLKCDSAGNLYAACGDGLSVWSPGGVLLGKVLIPGGLANFCFGKKGEIYLLNGKKFWLLKMADTIKSATADREARRNEEAMDIE